MMSIFLVIFDSLPVTGVQYLINDSHLTASFYELFAKHLSQADVHLPLWGPNMSSFNRIITLLVNVHNVTLYQSVGCQNCHKTKSARLWNSSLGSILTVSVWNNYATAHGLSNYGAAVITTQQWTNALEYGTCYRSQKN
jgi:hypothetical protein